MSFSRSLLLVLWSLLGLLTFASVSSAQDNPHKIFTARDGLAGDYVTAIAFTRDGSAWIGTTEGATHIAPNRWTSFTRAHGLGDSWITAIAIAPNEHVWFGTHSGGVSVLDPHTKTITTYNLDNSDIPSNFVSQLVLDSESRVWIGTLNNGVAQFDPATGQWSQQALPHTHITQLARGLDKQNPLWTIADGRVYALQNNQWTLHALPNDESAERMFDDHRQMVAVTREKMYLWNGTAWDKYAPFQGGGAPPWFGTLNESDIMAQAEGTGDDVWVGTARGLYVFNPTSKFAPPKPYPVVLIHGWTVAGDDTLETSEFKFLKSYADRDGIPMYYARGVSPKNTLYQNAQVIRDEIARVKKETGADKVNIIAFSMGGMNTRAYLETSLYADDVNRAIILGTPQAGVDIWKPILFQQILQKPNEPSTIELSPEYAQQVVNATRSPNPKVPYDLLIGDARQQAGLDFLDNMPASDALISVDSAFALGAPNVRRHVNADLHDWNPQAVPLELTGYLYPRDTWERYLRNALRNNDNAPMGYETLPSLVGRGAGGEVRQGNHTPVVTEKISAGETMTRTVLIDENKAARFIAYYPGGKIDFSLVAPDGKKYEPNDLPRDEDGVLSLSTDIANFSGYAVKNAQPGEWQMVLKRTDNGSEPIHVSTYVELDAPLQLNAFARFPTLALGATNTITGVVTIQAGEAVRDVKMTAHVAQPAANFGEPFTVSEIELFDDGKHDDGAAHDGFFANTFSPARGGWYPVTVTAQGDNFARATEFLFAANPGGAEIINVEPRPPLEPNTPAHVEFVNTRVERAGDYLLSVRANYPDQTWFARVFPFSLTPGTVALSVAVDSDFYVAGQPRSFEYQLLDASHTALPVSTHLVPMDTKTP